MPTFLMHKLLEASVKEEICKLVPMFLSMEGYWCLWNHFLLPLNYMFRCQVLEKLKYIRIHVYYVFFKYIYSENISYPINQPQRIEIYGLLYRRDPSSINQTYKSFFVCRRVFSSYSLISILLGSCVPLPFSL